MNLKQLLKIAFDCGYDTSVMYNCGDGDAYKDFESFYRSEIKQLTLTDVVSASCDKCDNTGVLWSKDRLSAKTCGCK